jgi:acetyl-CoA acetyltransferase
MGKAFVIGISMTKFVKEPKLKVEKMGAQAVWDAIEDAGINVRDIQEVYCGNVFAGAGVGQKVMVEVGFMGMPITNIENCCSSASNAFREVYHAVALGRIDIGLAVGVENITSILQGRPISDEDDLEGAMGNTFAAIYAQRGRRYMWEHGLKPEHLAKIAVINKKNGYYNEKASFGALIDIDTVLNSPMVADPLHLYDCNTHADGAAAAIIVNERIAKQSKRKPVEIVASSLKSGRLPDRFIDMAFEDVSHRTAQEAYQQAGIGPEDIDFAEVHDCFTIAEVLRVEGIGLCERGGMAKWIEDGTIEITGKKPINPSGGLLAKGHPIGATGIAQIYELCKQIRGEAGKRQIKGARIGMAMNRGGAIAGIEANACTVHILKKS